MSNLNHIGLSIITLLLSSSALSADNSGGEAMIVDNAASTNTESRQNAPEVITPPYTNTFDDISSLEGYTNINLNNDGQFWGILNGNAQMMCNDSLDMNSWLITPGIMLEQGQLYEVSLDASIAHRMYPERLEVCAGSSATPEGMTISVIEKTDLTTTKAVHLRGYLNVKESGVYYVGIHGCSDYDSYYVLVDNLSIKASTPTAAPDQVVGLTVTPDPLGNLAADISFTTPSLDIDGNELSEITKVEVLRGTTVVKTFDNPDKNVSLTYRDEVDESGTYAYTVVCYNESGRGKETISEAFIGISIPSEPKNAKLEETSNPGEVRVSWTAPTTDYAGRPINQDLISYTVVDAFTRVTVAEGVKGTETVFTAVAPDTQDFMQYGIFASTSAGTSENAAMTGMYPVGQAYTLPVEESFANGNVENNYVWGNAPDEGSTAWIEILTDKNGVDSQDGDNGYVGCFSNYSNESATLYSGKIDVGDAANPVLTFYYYKSDGGENTISVLIDAGEGPVKAKTFVCGPEKLGWTRALIPLTDYRNKNIRISFHFTNSSHSYTIIDNISICNQKEIDMMAVSINVPENVNVYEQATLLANVLNNGSRDVEEYVVKLYCNNEVVQTYPGELLKSGENKYIGFYEEPGLDSKAERKYSIEVSCANDEVPENNRTLESSMFVILPSYPMPSGLKADMRDNDIELSWTGPNLEDMPSEPITDDVEQYESYAIDKAGNWKFADMDQSETYGFYNVSFPNEESPMAWMVFDNNDIDDYAFAAHSGSKFFAAMAAKTPPNDDWLISPELDGHPQTVSFYAKAVDYYEESFEVLYSSTGTDVDDFNVLAEVSGIPNSEWKQYSYSLPEGAKHFAIHCISNDALGLFVDDLTYAPADGEKMVLEFQGYNVYKDGVKQTSTPISETSYKDEGAATANHKYFVTAMYDKGESAASNIATYSVGVDERFVGNIGIKGGDGCIVITDASGSRIEIYTTDGVNVFSGLGADYARISVTGGIYIVKAGDRVAKVAVK